jgi:hypothetical protein
MIFGPSVVPKLSSSTSTHTVGGKKILCTGKALQVTQTQIEITVENIHNSTIAVRISWDGKDPNGTGQGEDSFINNAVTPNQVIKQEFKNHASVQIWAWDDSGQNIDSCSEIITPNP